MFASMEGCTVQMGVRDKGLGCKCAFFCSFAPVQGKGDVTSLM